MLCTRVVPLLVII